MKCLLWTNKLLQELKAVFFIENYFSELMSTQAFNLKLHKEYTFLLRSVIWDYSCIQTDFRKYSN